MPKRKSQLSRHTSKTKSVKVRRIGETSYEHSQPESSTERSQSLTATAQGQRISRIRNRSAPHTYRSAFNYDHNTDDAKQRAVTIGAMYASQDLFCHNY